MLSRSGVFWATLALQVVLLNSNLFLNSGSFCLFVLLFMLFFRCNLYIRFQCDLVSALMAFCGAVAASFVWKCVWIQCQSQMWRDNYVNVQIEKDFTNHSKMSRVTFQNNYQLLYTRV